MKKFLINIWNFITFTSKCNNCNEISVRFSHTEHFSLGEPNIYICKNCKSEFVIFGY